MTDKFKNPVMPKMTEDEAYAYYDLVLGRLLGWSIVTGGGDMRRREAKQSCAFFRQSVVRGPRWERFIAAAMAAEPIHELWPEDMREEIERQINTKVPRAINEPTSTEFRADMREHCDPKWELPEVLRDHGRDT